VSRSIHPRIASDDVSNATGNRLCSLTLGVIWLTAGCERRVAPAATTTVTTTTTVTSVGADGVARVAGTHWSLEVGPDVRFQSISKSGAGDQSGLTTTINGVPFEVRDGRLLLDQLDLGPVPSGAKLRVSAAGVFVEGERRGATPKLVEAGGG